MPAAIPGASYLLFARNRKRNAKTNKGPPSDVKIDGKYWQFIRILKQKDIKKYKAFSRENGWKYFRTRKRTDGYYSLYGRKRA